jgi:hypothetical protein
VSGKHRILALAVILTAALTVTAIPAAAKKGGGGGDPAAYEVTLTLQGAGPGLASTCPATLRMNESGGRSGTVLQADGSGGTSPADLYYQGPGVADGCYTGVAAGSEPSEAQFFRVYLTNAGALDHIDWFFDVDVILSVNKRGKPTGGYTVTHKYWLQSLSDVEWIDGVVTGSFELWDYTRDVGWTLLATPNMEFAMDVTCADGC